MSSPVSQEQRRPFHVMSKPIGPRCNLNCRYCFYLEKEELYQQSGEKKQHWAMSDALLERYVRDYIASQPGETITFAWQGGEPTLLGLDFFRRAVDLQRRYQPAQVRIENALQTNGILLDDEWCRFFRDQGFLIGLSIDGPQHLHDCYRVDRGGRGTHRQVMAAAERLLRHQVAFNTLSVVHRRNAEHPHEVYRFLRDIGSRFLQFIPLVERQGEGSQGLEGPPQSRGMGGVVSPWSVGSQQWGDFLSGVWDEWIQADVGRIFVNLFDVQLGLWAGLPATMCVFSEHCGRAVVVEHNGDMYSCDHFVYPEYYLGNIQEQDMTSLVESPRQQAFARAKQEDLPSQCRSCPYLFACQGECPKHRFLYDSNQEAGLNYLCAGYLRFFRHIDADMRKMVELLRQGQAPALIMQDKAKQAAAYKQSRPNDPCPCGSGKKFKKCHGRGQRQRN